MITGQQLAWQANVRPQPNLNLVCQVSDAAVDPHTM
jgi:hypothetical protein